MNKFFLANIFKLDKVENQTQLCTNIDYFIGQMITFCHMDLFKCFKIKNKNTK